MITLNAEIFHSLYVVISLQTATSPLMVLLFVVVDFVHACFSFRRMLALAKSVPLTGVDSKPLFSSYEVSIGDGADELMEIGTSLASRCVTLPSPLSRPHRVKLLSISFGSCAAC